jgi:hypothetical protein
VIDGTFRTDQTSMESKKHMTSRYKNLSDALNHATLDWKIAQAVRSDSLRISSELQRDGCATVHVDGRQFRIRKSKQTDPVALPVTGT